MINVLPINCNYCITKIQNHGKVKPRLLDLIQQADHTSPFLEKSEVDITRTDWHNCSDAQRPWFKFFAENFYDSIMAVYRRLGYGGFRLNEIWFQQYGSFSQHGWHTHGSNFTNVYYLELPKDSPKTQLIEPYTKNKFYLEVEEGDLVTFPSFILHRTGPNVSQDPKSIISFNINAVYSDEIYGQGI